MNPANPKEAIPPEPAARSGTGALYWVFVLSSLIIFVDRALLADQIQLFGVLFDDAYISLRHAHNFALGHGFNFNPGERVEGYTNFSWTALMSLAFFLDLSPELWIKGVGIVSGMALVVATATLARPLIGDTPSGLLALAMAFADGLPLYAVSGLETILFAALLTAGFALLFRQAWVTASLVFALAAMTRMEAVIVYGVAAAYALWVARSLALESGSWNAALQTLAKMALPFGVVFGGFYLARWSYYGYPFPNTYYAKVGTALNSYERGLAHFQQMTAHAGLSIPIAVAVVATAVTVAATLMRRKDASVAEAGQAGSPSGRGTAGKILTLVAASGIYLLYTIRVGGDEHITFGDRFLYHILPVLVVAIVSVITLAVSTTILPALRSSAPSEGDGRGFRLVAIITSAALALAFTQYRCPAIQRTYEGITGWASLGVYLAKTAEPEDVVAVSAAGAIPYFSGLRAIDMYGLADLHIAHSENPDLGSGLAAHEKSDMAYVLGRKPRYLSDWVRPGALRRFEGYRLAAVVRMDGSEIDPARVLELNGQFDAAEIQRLRNGEGSIPGEYSFALYERRAGRR